MDNRYYSVPGAQLDRDPRSLKGSAVRNAFAASLIILMPSLLIADDKQPFLGINIGEINKGQMAELKVPVRIGVLITEVVGDSPADKAGLKVNDILVRINSTSIADFNTLKQWIGTTSESETYRFEIYRHGKKWDRKLIPVKVAYVSKSQQPEPTQPPNINEWKEWEAEQAKLPLEDRPFDIKGDRLGMSLDMFKAKHHRIVQGDARPAPFCSDSNPDFENPLLLYKPELKKAGIVHARTTYPFEENGVNPRATAS